MIPEVAQNLEFEALRQKFQQQPIPNTNFETAVFLLDNSKNTSLLSEIEKEIKLANLDKQEKQIILMLINSYQEQLFLDKIYLEKHIENYFKINSSDKLEHLSHAQKLRKDLEEKKFDCVNHLRRAISIATVSRGFEGFERNAQNTTISSTTLTGLQDSVLEQKKGLLNKFFGGLRK